MNKETETPLRTEFLEGRGDDGRFAKGNKIQSKRRLSKHLQELRDATRAELLECAMSLTKPFSEVPEELSRPDKLSRLQFLTTSALSGKKYQFIQWLLEMAVGKPRFTMEVDDDKGNKVVQLQYTLAPKGNDNGQE